MEAAIRLLKQNIVEIQSFYTDGPVALDWIPLDMNEGDRAKIISVRQAIAVLEAAEKVDKKKAKASFLNNIFYTELFKLIDSLPEKE